jgi:adenosylcobinamide-phosphate synthase
LRVPEHLLVLGVALALDRLGELPTAWHPVGWIGILIAGLTRRAPHGSPSQFWYGVFIALVPAMLSGLIVEVLDRVAGRATSPIRVVLRGLLLSWTFSLQGLERAARAVEDDLRGEELDKARDHVRALVSRPTTTLASAQIAAAAIESLAENASDSVIAPLLWWRVGGPAAAAVYRAINTADAMVGYHGRYELLGRASARADDIVNLLPARLTGVAICLSSPGSAAFATMRQDHGRTESPNAGWPIAAMAGGLTRRLTKVGHYSLGQTYVEPNAHDIGRAVKVMRRAVAMVLPVLCLIPGRPT